MSDLPISSSYRSRPGDPVDEDERNRVAARLNSAFTDGTLDPDEYRSRLDRLFAAGTLGELVPVVDGLPPAPTYDQPAIVAQSLSTTTAPGELTPARHGTRAAAIAVGSVAAAVLVVVILLVVLL
ncbi:hypothetical protein FHX74_000718 [Friedmanniella endophytica]|uniref:DUF1707 domain-containing protein n=1 Tax=Microlunatus kandeliicorticis TaxID=1759536 RepID=A0A7W3P4P7_9ACTN|nr:DUF1707 domain-containing protein [Microlunatus kandeliicorticis]MBA8793124.1 hypothetical protein [Microlunatus kandeliicorticis]